MTENTVRWRNFICWREDWCNETVIVVSGQISDKTTQANTVKNISERGSVPDDVPVNEPSAKKTELSRAAVKLRVS